MKKTIILITIVFILLLSTFVNALYIDTKTPHIIGQNNLVYVITMDNSDFVLQLKDINQNTLKSWEKSQMTKCTEGKYKVNMRYDKNFIEGDYSLVAKDFNNQIYTVDFKVINTTLWERFVSFIKGTINAVSNFF